MNPSLPRPLAPIFREASEEAGSAYIVTLMVLFVLTILGVSLTLVTQTELLVGSQERTIQRVFYAADSGVNVAIARALVANDTRYRKFSSGEDRDINGTTVLHVYDEVEMAPMLPISPQPCTLCQLHGATQGSQGSLKFVKNNYAVTSVATRFGAPVMTGGEPNYPESVPLGRRTVSTIVSFQPSEDIATQRLDVEEKADLIRF